MGSCRCSDVAPGIRLAIILVHFKSSSYGLVLDDRSIYGRRGGDYYALKRNLTSSTVRGEREATVRVAEGIIPYHLALQFFVLAMIGNIYS